MLILTRRLNERIRINDDITFEILGMSGNQIKIGVTAPQNVSVHREEVYNRINYDKKFIKDQDREV